MKKSGKRWIGITVSLVLAIQLAACGSSNGTSGTETEDGTDVAGTRTDSDDLKREKDLDDVALKLQDKFGLYGYENPITLKMGFGYDTVFEWQNGENIYDNTWTNLYREMGINQEILFSVDVTQLAAKLSTAIASGNYPDLISGSVTDMVQYARTGVIADISEVFEEYASDELKAYLNYGGINVLDSCRVDGKLYGLAQACESQTEGMMMFVRQDWLDNLGLTMPKTMEELKTVARAFTADDPDGNGEADTYGLALNGKDGFTFWSGIQAYFEGYGAAPGYWSDNFTFIEQDGELVWGGTLKNEMKAGLADLQEMYANGWLTRDFGTMGYKQVISDFTSGTCGIFFAPYWGVMSRYGTLLKNDINARVSAAFIPDGMGEGSSRTYIPMTTTRVWMISSQCEHPEALIKLMNLSVRFLVNYENEQERKMFSGERGVYSDWKSSWIPFRKPGEVIDTELLMLKALETGSAVEGMTEDNLEEFNQMMAFYEAKEDGTLEELLETGAADIITGAAASTVYPKEGGGNIMLRQLAEGRLVYSAYNTAVTEKMASCYSVLNKLAFETIIKIICGESVESYDVFLESWLSLGGEEVTGEANEWYKENVAH